MRTMNAGERAWETKRYVFLYTDEVVVVVV